MRPGRILAAGLVMTAGLTACSPQPDTSHCSQATPPDVAQLQGALLKQGVLRHAYASTVEGVRLVSAELHATDQPKDKKGDVLTFATIGTDGTADFRAVDRYAREESRLPAASFGVARAGVYASRACAASHRGAAG